jgi:quinone-modifying oxidoreductase subunit QmoC
MMIRAGKREEVLSSDSMWMCTSCYNCVVRCPRKLPITQIMHGLATYAHKLGLAPKMQPTRDFSLQFWNNCTKTGRVNECADLGLYFRGIDRRNPKGWAIARRFGLLDGRLDPLEALGADYKDRRTPKARKKASRN